MLGDDGCKSSGNTRYRRGIPRPRSEPNKVRASPAGPVTSADYSNTMRRRHRFVLVSVLLPLLLMVPAVRAAVGSKNQGAPSVKGNRYTRFCKSCVAGPDHPELCAKFFDFIGQLSQRIGSLDAKYFRRGVRCRTLSEPAALSFSRKWIRNFYILRLVRKVQIITSIYSRGAYLRTSLLTTTTTWTYFFFFYFLLADRPAVGRTLFERYRRFHSYRKYCFWHAKAFRAGSRQATCKSTIVDRVKPPKTCEIFSSPSTVFMSPNHRPSGPVWTE